MAAFVVAFYRFDAERVFLRMGEAELSYYFLHGFLLFTRWQQHQSFLLMSSVGSFFVKKGQQTVIEELSLQASDIYKLLGYGNMDLPEIAPATDPLENLFRQMARRPR